MEDHPHALDFGRIRRDHDARLVKASRRAMDGHNVILVTADLAIAGNELMLREGSSELFQRVLYCRIASILSQHEDEVGHPSIKAQPAGQGKVSGRRRPDRTRLSAKSIDIQSVEQISWARLHVTSVVFLLTCR
jgi:hypothetical protein